MGYEDGELFGGLDGKTGKDDGYVPDFSMFVILIMGSPCILRSVGHLTIASFFFQMRIQLIAIPPGKAASASTSQQELQTKDSKIEFGHLA